MNNQFLAMCEDLTNDIKKAYEGGCELAEAERLAAKFLHAQIQVGTELQKADLDARMRKTGVKAIRAAVYLDGATKGDKKPSDTLLEAVVNSDKIVQDEQTSLDTAENNRNAFENYLSVFREAHIYFRGIAKGRFE